MYKIGYTQGVYDVFHIGHLNLLKKAKSMCTKLIVGVNDDALVQAYKNKKTVIPVDERVEIVRAIRWVDEAHITTTLDKVEAYNRFKFDVIFIGDDWKGSERWAKTEKEMAKFNVKVEYLPHTPGISSTMLRTILGSEERQ